MPFLPQKLPLEIKMFMKKRNYFIGFLICGMMSLNAQTNQPKSGLVLTDPVSNCAYRYFYFPNLEAYFDTQKSIYIYSEKGKWITAEELPVGYRGYSVYNKMNVTIKDYDDDNITQFVKIHKKKYPYVNNAKSRDALMASDE